MDWIHTGAITLIEELDTENDGQMGGKTKANGTAVQDMNHTKRRIVK